MDLETHTIVPRGEYSRDALDRVSVLVCRNCEHGVVAVEEQFVGEHPRREGLEKGGVISWRGFHWWPLPGAELSSDVPGPIASAFEEANRALHARCFRSSAVMARRTLEAVCADRGQTTGRLVDRLTALANSGVLQPTLADWGHEVRLIGNIGAHFDPLDDVPQDDAQELVRFTRELLRYLYELPAELARRRLHHP